MAEAVQVAAMAAEENVTVTLWMYLKGFHWEW